MDIFFCIIIWMEKKSKRLEKGGKKKVDKKRKESKTGRRGSERPAKAGDFVGLEQV